MDTIDEGYFDTLGIRIVRTRRAGLGYRRMRRGLQIVNEQFARHYWPGVDAVGKLFRLENWTGALVEVVGVAQTIKYRQGSERPTDFVYLPLAQASDRAHGPLCEDRGRSAAIRGFTQGQSSTRSTPTRR